MDGKINAEWDRLGKVAVHKPGVEAFFGILDPSASLYNTSFNLHSSQAEHDELVRVLKDQFGVMAVRLKDSLAYSANSNESIKKRLQSIASKRIVYSGNATSARSAGREMRINLNSYGSDYLFDAALLNPNIRIKSHNGNITASTTLKNPISNMYFMRDQQIITNMGVFISRMSKLQRKGETDIAKLFWDSLGLPISGAAQKPAFIEGGDYMPMNDFAIIGTGRRTNLSGAKQLISNSLNFDEVAIVCSPENELLPKAYADQMIDMHLDTYFNVAGSATVVGSKYVLESSMLQAYVRERKGEYKKSGSATSLYKYIIGKGFNLIDIPIIEQLSYATNFLCIRDGTILAVDEIPILKKTLEYVLTKAKSNPSAYGGLLRRIRAEYAKIKDRRSIFPNNKQSRDSGIDAYAVNLTNLTGGYGGAHCMTVAFERA